MSLLNCIASFLPQEGMLSFRGKSYTNILPSHSSFKLNLSIKQVIKNSMIPLSAKNPKLILKCGPSSCNKLPPNSWPCLQSVFFDAHKNLKTECSACFPYLWELPSLGASDTVRVGESRMDAIGLTRCHRTIQRCVLNLGTTENVDLKRQTS